MTGIHSAQPLELPYQYCENFAPAFPYHFCRALPASFWQPGNSNFGEPYTRVYRFPSLQSCPSWSLGHSLVIIHFPSDMQRRGGALQLRRSSSHYALQFRGKGESIPIEQGQKFTKEIYGKKVDFFLHLDLKFLRTFFRSLLQFCMCILPIPLGIREEEII